MTKLLDLTCTTDAKTRPYKFNDLSSSSKGQVDGYQKLVSGSTHFPIA